MKNTIITLATVSVLAVSANAQVLNGDFEANTGSPTSWITGGGAVNDPLVYAHNGVVPASGGVGNALDLGPSGSATGNGGYAEQTISVAAGSYVLSFDYIGELSNAGVTFDVDLTGVSTFSDSITTASRYSTYTTLVNVASSGNLTLRFTETAKSGINAVIDNVSFTAVPEPSSTALLGLGALGLLARRKR